MKTKVQLLLLIAGMSLFLCSCTVTADRIYVVCRVDNGVTSCYKSNEDFYTIQEDGKLLPSIDPTLRAYPALQINPCEGVVEFEYVLPHLYTGTLTSLNHYIYILLQNGFTYYEYVYSDYQRLDILIYSDDDTYRILYNIYGEIRIYSENKAHILYINEEQNIKN